MTGFISNRKDLYIPLVEDKNLTKEKNKEEMDKRNTMLWKDICQYTNSKFLVDRLKRGSVLEDSMMNKNSTILGGIKETKEGSCEEVSKYLMSNI